MALFLGFDAGGTKTDCALAEDDRILARAQGASIKPLRVTMEEAQRNIAALLEEITRQSGRSGQIVDLRTVTASCIGTAGLRFPQTDGWMRRIYSACAGGAVEVCGDEEIALDAAFPGAAGVLVMAGTGSNILGRTGSGERLNVGGWGQALGDEGSGYWIGHQALRTAFRALDFGRRSPLLDRVVAFWQAGTLEEAVSIGNATPGPDFSKLSRLVTECAEEGDTLCLGILDLGGKLLGESAVEAFRRVCLLDPDVPPPGIAFTGSILKYVARVREAMFAAIREALPTAHVEAEAADPVLGALWRARHLVRAQ
ncbi:N-acetylglucosamine kinase [Paracidobacterium acidisoli]|uniref:ATPase n=1 Tax=Paracidobacterium acidisoli TaxID=2303751 RepID=A0A372IS73_9BACT|nr:BadF/BadG/BcrA/BcrD ATPase family protein [Paracidobacterium acidisoli]MBT9330511.1 ATPase [Paracidobacterium acidisoli]